MSPYPINIHSSTGTTMHLLQLIASFSTWPLTLALALTPEPTTINYGHWRLTLYENWSFTGSYSKKSVRSEYWTPAGTLGGIVYCADEYSLADGRGDISTPCNDTSFSCSLLDYKSEYLGSIFHFGVVSSRSYLPDKVIMC